MIGTIYMLVLGLQALYYNALHMIQEVAAFSALCTKKIQRSMMVILMLKKHVLSILQNRSSKPNQQTIPSIWEEVINLWLFRVHF